MKKKLLLTALAAGLVLPSVNALAKEGDITPGKAVGDYWVQAKEVAGGKFDVTVSNKNGFKYTFYGHATNTVTQTDIDGVVNPDPSKPEGTDGIDGTPKAEELEYVILVQVDDKVRAYKLSVPKHRTVTEADKATEIYNLVVSEGITQGKNFLAGDIMDIHTAVATGVIQLQLLSEDVAVKSPEKEEGKKALPKTSAVK